MTGGPEVRAFVGLGANLGEPQAALRAAIDALGVLPRTRLTALSSFYRSAPVQAGGPDFVNAVAELSTALEPEALLAELHRIEAEHGRVRGARNAPRTLDLDLLAWGDAVRRSPHLTLPHPRAHLRAFVLLPWLELAPHMALPGIGPLASWLPQVSGQVIRKLDP